MGTALNVFPSPIRAARFIVRDSWSRVVLVLNPRFSRFCLMIGLRFTKNWPRLNSEAFSGNPKLLGVNVFMFFLIVSLS